MVVKDIQLDGRVGGRKRAVEEIDLDARVCGRWRSG
jgi:hypothetical protein